MEENKKLDWLQVYRAIITIFVVWGHIVLLGQQSDIFNVTNRMIYLFHMPAFFAMSGFLFGLKESTTEPAVIVKKKLVSLGIPYLFFSFFYLFVKLFIQNVVIVQKKVQMVDFLRILFFPNISTSIYWFLFVLILFFLIFTVCRKNKKIIYLISFISLLYFIMWKGECLNIFNDCFDSFVGYSFCFSISMLCGQKYKHQEKISSLKMVIFYVFVILFVLFAPLFVMNIKEMFLLNGLNLLVGLCSLLFLIGGICFVGLITIVLLKNPLLTKIFVYIGNVSWFIY